MNELGLMKRALIAAAGSLVALALAGCASSMVPKRTSNVKSKLIANTEIKAGDIDVSSSQAVVTLIGGVSSETIKSDAERIARGTWRQGHEQRACGRQIRS